MNKVCASGMKAVMLAAQQVQLGHPGVLVAVRIRALTVRNIIRMMIV